MRDTGKESCSSHVDSMIIVMYFYESGVAHIPNYRRATFGLKPCLRCIEPRHSQRAVIMMTDGLDTSWSFAMAGDMD